MKHKIIFRRDISFRIIGKCTKLTPRSDGRWELIVDDVCEKDYNMFVKLTFNNENILVNFSNIDAIEEFENQEDLNF